VDEPGEGGPPGLGAPPLDDAGIALARAHFAFARITVASLDWLSLSATGHRRARFERAGDGWQSTWLTP
jgi:pyridoxamine 5'-phosphate oxidase